MDSFEPMVAELARTRRFDWGIAAVVVGLKVAYSAKTAPDLAAAHRDSVGSCRSVAVAGGRSVDIASAAAADLRMGYRM